MSAEQFLFFVLIYPQIASVGLTEVQAKEKGFEVKVGKVPFTGNSKATIVDSADGFVKIALDAIFGEILGVHIVGPQATEFIAEAVTVPTSHIGRCWQSFAKDSIPYWFITRYFLRNSKIAL
jgi:pyruvate/2-oxoglutarate dehydrogenase complex dihydrolipoamide dehydrogenase (E3) component